MAPIADGYVIFVSEALMRFGRWEELLAEPAPPPGLPLSTALWHFTRASAYTALDRPEEARRENQAFESAAMAVPAGYTFGNNQASDLLGIARHQLAGEMAARAGRYDEAIASLREAGKIEDSLRYAEPPNWISHPPHARSRAARGARKKPRPSTARISSTFRKRMVSLRARTGTATPG
jgi:tetratricopeptide (TPR) repeat protein